MEVAFEKLDTSNLIVDCVYEDHLGRCFLAVPQWFFSIALIVH